MRHFGIVMSILCLALVSCRGEDEVAQRPSRPNDPRPYLVHWETSRPDSIPVTDSLVFQDSVFFVVQDARDRISPDHLAAIDIRRDSLLGRMVEDELGQDASFGVVVLHVGPEGRTSENTEGGQ